MVSYPVFYYLYVYLPLLMIISLGVVYSLLVVINNPCSTSPATNRETVCCDTGIERVTAAWVAAFPLSTWPNTCFSVALTAANCGLSAYFAQDNDVSFDIAIGAPQLIILSLIGNSN